MRLHFNTALGLANGLVDRVGNVIPAAVALDCTFIDGSRAINGMDTYVRTVTAMVGTPVFKALPLATQAEALGIVAGLSYLSGKLSDPVFQQGPSGSTKCGVLGHLGRVFHAMQDFYAHSNYADRFNPSLPSGISNPPGLHLKAPAALLDMVQTAGPGAGQPATGQPAVPKGLSTSCYDLIDLSNCKGRIDHDRDLGKDEGTVTVTLVPAPLPNKVTTSRPTTPRGKVLTNFDDAVQGAVVQTVTAWGQFGTALLTRYGKVRGTEMICALTHDDPVTDCPHIARRPPLAGSTTTMAPGSVSTSTTTTASGPPPLRLPRPLVAWARRNCCSTIGTAMEWQTGGRHRPSAQTAPLIASCRSAPTTGTTATGQRRAPSRSCRAARSWGRGQRPAVQARPPAPTLKACPTPTGPLHPGRSPARS